MKVSLIGPAQAGKTTLFGALTRLPVRTGAAGYGEGAHLAVVEVPDRRFDRLVAIYEPRKATRAAVEFLDPAAEAVGRAGFSAAFLAELRQSDALAAVVRAFESDRLPPPDGGLDPLRDYRNVEAELILADLQLVETRLERLDKDSRSRGKAYAQTVAREREPLEQARAHLEAELPIRTLELAAAETEALAHLTFLTRKPVVVVANIGEEALAAAASPLLAPLHAWAERAGTPVLPICAAVEQEIAGLAPEEEQEYLEAMGIAESGRYRFLRAVHQLLGRICFFTVGADEVRAWELRRGETAITAAGKIHTDLARGFIRAEVVPAEPLIAAGDEKQARQQGLFRVENRGYVVQDGDVLNIRFSV